MMDKNVNDVKDMQLDIKYVIHNSLLLEPWGHA